MKREWRKVPWKVLRFGSEVLENKIRSNETPI